MQLLRFGPPQWLNWKATRTWRHWSNLWVILLRDPWLVGIIGQQWKLGSKSYINESLLWLNHVNQSSSTCGRYIHSKHFKISPNLLEILVFGSVHSGHCSPLNLFSFLTQLQFSFLLPNWPLNMLLYLELTAKSVPINVHPENLLPAGSQSLPVYSEGRYYLVTTEHEPSAYCPVV